MSLSLQVACAARPMPGERACGDRAVTWDDGEVVVVAVIDGLGHGPAAASAAEAAVSHIADHLGEPLTELLRGCDAALRGGRGVVATVVRIRRSNGAAEYIAVGNVEARIAGGGDVPLIPTPGVVGMRLQALRERAFTLRAGCTLVIYTDGISSRFRLDELHGRPAAAIVRTLLAEHAKNHDDAGCAVVVT
ncbi:MAG: SpoIIE family protein phosphatase [Nannocystaceae bacterium]